MYTQVKKAEAQKAIQDGADEIDLVINIGWLKKKSFKQVESKIDVII